LVDAHALTQAPEIAECIDASADVVAARSAVERYADAAPDAAERLLDEPTRCLALVTLAAASRSLTEAIIGEPALLDVLDDPEFISARDPEVCRATFVGLVTTARDDGDGGARVLRRAKRREFLRIALRDLLGLADLVTVGSELTTLADGCLAAALELAAPTIPFAVVGMGKLGGTELNYSSDVDVLFVHDGDGREADRVARAVLSIMTTPTADGIVFRTDADLRPEGRAGALSRTVDSYEAWWARWARHWEFQALLKARPVAGDADLADKFMATSRAFVWRDVLDADAIREVRTMKARAEAELDRKGLGERELKRGRGGIRDIEFAVQLLQLVHGRHDPKIRSRTTLVALAQLAAGGYVERRDVGRLGDAYVFLRTVEHRLQLRDEHQTHTLPSDPAEVTRLARVLGYRDQPRATAFEAFTAEHRAHQATVRAIHERLFFAPLLDTLAGHGPLSGEAAEERLAAFGFVDAAHTRAALRELTSGLSRTSRVFQGLLPVILDWLSTTPDPDLGLLQLRRLAEGPTRASVLAGAFRDSTGAAERACRLLGSSRMLGDGLFHQPAFIETLGDDVELAREHRHDELVDAAMETLQWRTDVNHRRAGLRRFKWREFLRIAARDVLGLAPIEITEREWSAVADACVDAALHALEPTVPFAVIGMGRLGGQELSYASDIDVLFVYDGDRPSHFEAAERTATQLIREIGATTPEGQTFRVDAALRPEGKKGVLARSLDGYRGYYADYGLVWEFQSLLRARPVAGDPDLAQRFLGLVEPLVARDLLPEDDVREIRRIKLRVEQERIPPGEDPDFHLKLGKGALTDVEFTVQLLQLEYGAAQPEVRVPGTIAGLRRLVDAGLLDPDDGVVLEESYRFCERARNARYLVTGAPGDALPGGVDDLRIGRLLGFVENPQGELRDEFRRVTRRARRVVDRVFYGRTDV
jgi:glutamate-ammonia-ligase adenylyltransferase